MSEQAEQVELESLDDVFSNSTPEKEPEPEKVEKEGATTAPDAESEPEASTDAKAKEESEPESWTLKAVLDEREKRQKYEKELAELRKQLEAKEEKAKRPDVFEDQDGAFKYLEDRISGIEMQTRFNMSRELMSSLKDDYEQREAQFLELAQQNPALQEQLRGHPNPAKFAYEQAVKAEKAKQLESIGDLDEYKAKLKAEILAEIEAERTEGKSKPSIQPSLATTRSAGTKEEIRLESVNELFST